MYILQTICKVIKHIYFSRYYSIFVIDKEIPINLRNTCLKFLLTCEPVSITNIELSSVKLNEVCQNMGFKFKLLSIYARTEMKITYLLPLKGA